jgi:hypothetical protein
LGLGISRQKSCNCVGKRFPVCKLVAIYRIHPAIPICLTESNRLERSNGFDVASWPGNSKKIREEIEALKGDALLERKNAFDQLSPPTDDEREFRLFLGLALETALKAEFGLGQWKGALEAYQGNSSNA